MATKTEAALKRALKGELNREAVLQITCSLIFNRFPGINMAVWVKIKDKPVELLHISNFDMGAAGNSLVHIFEKSVVLGTLEDKAVHYMSFPVRSDKSDDVFWNYQFVVIPCFDRNFKNRLIFCFFKNNGPISEDDILELKSALLVFAHRLEKVEHVHERLLPFV